MDSFYPDVPNVERMSLVLDAILSHPGGMCTRDLLAVTQLPKTTLYRLLNAMTQHGFLSFHKPANLYTLGTRFLFSPASSGQWDFGLRHVATPLIQQLASEIQESIKLNTISGIFNHTIAVAEGPKPIRITVDLGALFPLHAGASGKILMQDFSESDLLRYFSVNVDVYTDKTITNLQTMLDELAKIRAQGYALDTGEIMPEVFAVAVPVYYSGMIIAALSVTYPSILHNSFSISRSVELLQDTSRKISEAFTPDIPKLSIPNVKISDNSINR